MSRGSNPKKRIWRVLFATRNPEVPFVPLIDVVVVVYARIMDMVGMLKVSKHSIVSSLHMRFEMIANVSANARLLKKKRVQKDVVLFLINT